MSVYVQGYFHTYIFYHLEMNALYVCRPPILGIFGPIACSFCINPVVSE